ncbi:pyridoxamine 5'-phosphate oxidase family protein [Natronomonas sp. F2-12]|jgi:nitroimidazol reductase NimA-like FMN-containing flavoprotein (pyridoxamine 5'-phosphate oxidase superfamily)|uniref:Pyridoxamine 5'-phosphate oxidase family protein n=1 Tax=Natronomonas aquatica TaxID=2841590 RepID=A0A9R1CS26_9EURY|nr:pyridoxamine 5'-phosphate oxidase family protein [Natronomonas aquatica]MCQ4332661.1 pyridoxamine 5'-phosphate oxidase family protein [Natronomonas aquatica]
MATDRRAEMSAEKKDAFLGAHETGVLSLARGDEPYAIPVSYGYDGTGRHFYLRLVSTPESEKRQFLASEPNVRFVVVDDETDTYRSVVATGTLTRMDPDELAVEEIQQYGEARRPLFEVWPEDREDLDIGLYRLSPTSITGREVTIARDDGT